jgi:tetratricopeptide (TPR) repeat protein
MLQVTTTIVLFAIALPALAGSAVDEAFSLARQARDTANGSFYTRAEEIIAPLLRDKPDDFDALKVRTWVLLGQHRFREALELARALNKRTPDDLQVYGFVVDASMELGLYKEAERAAQWMLDLRPGNVAGLTRGAYLREIFGDLDGALDFMRQAYTRTRPEERGDRAWILTHIGNLLLEKREYASADKVLLEALRIYPDYHYALGRLAKTKTAQGMHAAAAALYRKRYEMAPHPENLFDVAAALEAAGDFDGARQAFSDFEKAARAEMHSADNSNRELALYYADYAHNPAEALRVARQEAGARQDVHTLDVYAWVLFCSGDRDGAAAEMHKVLATGVKSPSILAHASAIDTARVAAMPHNGEEERLWQTPRSGSQSH